MNKKRAKFVPISNSKVENAFLLPGRQKCECAATKHELINNCLNCGRIVCAQEGSGPCWFCGSLVCTTEEGNYIRKESNKANACAQKLMSNKWPHQKDLNINDSENNSYDKVAQERKDRLLEFDRNSTQRTKVIDDQSDYYHSEGTSWIDPKKRELLKKKEEKLREERFAPQHLRPSKYTLDMKTGKMVKEEQSNTAAFELFEDPNLIISEPMELNNEVKREQNVNADFLTYVNPNQKKKMINNDDNNKVNINNKEKSSTRFISRLQDKELQEMCDEGLCLSMHQPWASLLVCGIKMHEGRSWFSNHRGRLWISSTAKVPSQESIGELTKFYMDRGVEKHMFPDSYPSGCILGCVDVVDCLPEDDYLAMYSDGESNSPFVFICENPRELRLKFPIKGKHKIYKLESHIHNAAKGGIQREM